MRRELAGEEDGPDGGARSRRDRRRPIPGALKCLHAHVAFALARPGYLLGEPIPTELQPRWPARLLQRMPSLDSKRVG